MALSINPQPLLGNWAGGWALDLHTTSSRMMPHGVFASVRSPIGELLYRCKYHSDQAALDPLAEAASDFLKQSSWFSSLAAIVPVPPSDLTRDFQPVLTLATRIGAQCGLVVEADLLRKTRATLALKNIDDRTERRRELEGVFVAADRRLAGRTVVVFDDLYRSGETLTSVTRALLRDGGVRRVYALTLTVTRTRR